MRRAYDELDPVYQLTRLRIRRGLTQQQLAERVGTTQSSIARLEHGKTKPTLETLARIAVALGGRVRVSIEAET